MNSVFGGYSRIFSDLALYTCEFYCRTELHAFSQNYVSLPTHSNCFVCFTFNFYINTQKHVKYLASKITAIHSINFSKKFYIDLSLLYYYYWNFHFEHLKWCLYSYSAHVLKYHEIKNLKKVSVFCDERKGVLISAALLEINRSPRVL